MLIRHTAATVALSLILTATIAWAAATACPQHYHQGRAPDLIDQKLTDTILEICYSEYGLLHSGITRTPLYSAEHLTREQVSLAGAMARSSSFFPDPHLAPDERAELADYAKSGWDRGHLVPSADMANAQAQAESFSLANIVPQNPRNNRGHWARIERAVRVLATQRGELYEVNGPIFSGEKPERIGGRVRVPSHLYKAIYDPQRQEGGAYVVANSSEAVPQTVSLLELQRLSGIDPFPGVSAAIKERPMKLPSPSNRQQP